MIRLCCAALILGMVAGACAPTDPRVATRGTQYLTAQTGYHTPPPATHQGRPPFDHVSYWDGDGVSGSPSILIRLGEQRAYFYKDDQLVGVSMISTGREGYGTPAGNFKVTQKSRDHRSNLYGDYVDANGNVVKANVGIRRDPKPPGTTFRGADMPYFLRIHGAVGMHAGYLPGYPASHGCIRLPYFMAQAFYNNVQNGTPVTVVR